MKLPITLLILAALVSCSSSSKISKAEIAPGVNLSGYKTFDFYSLDASGDTVTEKFEQRTKMLKTAIASELQQKGYRQVSQNPDLLVNIGVTAKEEIQTRQTDFRTDAPRYMGQRRYTWKSQEVETGRYRTGTIDIHLVDARQNIMVWRKVAESIIPDRDKQLTEKIGSGIKKIFTDFPNAAP